MPGLLFGWAPLFAQQGGAAPAPAAGSEGLMAPMMIFLPMILVFYLLIIRPQQRQEKIRKEMIGQLKKNDRVLTSAGIFGTVVSIDPQDDRMVLRTGDNTRLEMTRSSIVKVISESSEKASDASA